MKAIHGGKAKHDTIDAQKIAALLRGGMLPKAYVYPAEMRGTRDLLRRRTHLMRQRSELLSHGQHTTRQTTCPTSARTSLTKRSCCPSDPAHKPLLTSAHHLSYLHLPLSPPPPPYPHPPLLTSRCAMNSITSAAFQAYRLCLVRALGQMQQGIGWQTLGYLGQENRERLPQVGLFRSGHVVPASPSQRTKASDPLGENTWQRQSAKHPGPSTSSGRLLHAQAQNGFRYG